MQVSLVQAEHADIPLIRGLADVIWRDHYPEVISLDQIEYMLGLMYSEAKLSEQLHNPEFAYWLVLPAGATSKSDALGFIAVENKEEGLVFIHKFYLRHRGKGMGTSAFQLLLERMQPPSTIRLYVNRRNYKSVNFYFKNGFVIHSWVDQPFGQGYIMDDFLMEYRK
jgi:RimJ/RimL family protein N-acetyltransferase